MLCLCGIIKQLLKQNLFYSYLFDHHITCSFFWQTLKVHLCDIPTVLSVCMKYHRCFQLQIIFLTVCHLKPSDPQMMAVTSNGRHKKVRHFGIPHAIHTESFPSCASAPGAIGTPPPSARKFIAAAKSFFAVLLSFSIKNRCGICCLHGK